MFEDKINSVLNEIYLVEKGVRSMFEFGFTCPKESVSTELYKVEQFALHNNMLSYAFDTGSDDEITGDAFITCYFYKYHHQLVILKYLKECKNNLVRKWIEGKLLGYSEEAIKDFLEQHLYLELNSNMEKKVDSCDNG